MGRSPVLQALPLAANNQSGGSGWTMILLFLLMIVAMYFLLIRPQSKRRKEAQQMQSSIGVGAEIMTLGGLYGTVVEVDDDAITLEVAPGVTNRYAKGAISRVVTPAPEDVEEEYDEAEDDTEATAEADETPVAEEQVEEPAAEATEKQPAKDKPAKNAKDEVSAAPALPRDPTAN